MTSRVRDNILQLLKDHTYPEDQHLRHETDSDDMYYLCRCGQHISVMTGTPSHRDHLADVIEKYASTAAGILMLYAPTGVNAYQWAADVTAAAPSGGVLIGTKNDQGEWEWPK